MVIHNAHALVGPNDCHQASQHSAGVAVMRFLDGRSESSSSTPAAASDTQAQPSFASKKRIDLENLSHIVQASFPARLVESVSTYSGQMKMMKVQCHSYRRACIH